MNWFRSRLSRLSPSRRGAAAIVLGVAGGQAIAALSSLLLSRLFSPSDYGVYAVILAVSVALGTPAAWRLDVAIPLPEDEETALALTRNGLLAVLITAIATGILMVFSKDPLSRLLGSGSEHWLWLVPILVMSIGCYLVLNQLAIRHQRYTATGRRTFVQALITVVMQILLYFTGLGPGALVLGHAVGQVAGAASLIPGSGLLGTLGRGVTRSQLWSRYRSFPTLLAPSALLNVAGLQLPTVLLGAWYGTGVSGHFGMTQRLLTLPAALIGTAIAQVYLGELARSVRSRSGNPITLFASSSRRLSAVGGALALVLILGGPWVFSLALGAQWRESGSYAQAMALAMGMQLLAAPLGNTLIVMERQWTQLVWDLGRFVCCLGAVAVAHLLGWSALRAVWALGVATAVTYGALWIVSWRALSAYRPDAPAT